MNSQARRRTLLALGLVLVVALSWISLPGLAQQTAPDRNLTGDLFLLPEGDLANQAQDGGAQTCLSIASPGGDTSDEQAFTYILTNRSYRPADERITVLVDLGSSNGEQAQAGSGFELTGQLAFGNGTTLDAQPRTFAAASQPEEATLTFETPDNASYGRGPMALVLGLEAQAGTTGAPLGQDVQVRCGHERTRIISFPYEARGRAVAGPSGPGTGDDGGAAPTGDPDPWLVLAASGAGSVGFLAVGILAASGREFSQRRIHLLLGVSAGLLLAIALVRLVPASLGAEPDAPWTIALGLMGLYSVEWFLGGGHAHSHGHEPRDDQGSVSVGGGPTATSEDASAADQAGAHAPADATQEAHAHEAPAHTTQLAIVTFVVFAFHRVVGGLTLPAAFAVGQAAGIEATVGVLLHQAPGGLAAASLFLAAGWGKRETAKGVFGLALFNPLGALVGLYLSTFPAVIGHLLALSAATFIFISLAEVLPELEQTDYRWIVAGGFVAGYLIEYAVQWLTGLL